MKVNVLETSIMHASDIVYWLDGTSGANSVESDLQRLDCEMSINFATKPRDLEIVHKKGCMAMWRRSDVTLVSGRAQEADLQYPGGDSYLIEGVVRDKDGLYNPRRFSITAGGASGHTVVMYPSPKGARFGKGGGLIGSLRFQSDNAPAAWALLELEVTVAPNSKMHFKAQADGNGDFRLAMNRLPPLTENVDSYEAELSVRADDTASADAPIDPAELSEMEIGRLEHSGFESEVELEVRPGEVQHIKSHDEDTLIVKPD
jgi:hypothetical protein